MTPLQKSVDPGDPMIYFSIPELPVTPVKPVLPDTHSRPGPCGVATILMPLAIAISGAFRVKSADETPGSTHDTRFWASACDQSISTGHDGTCVGDH